MDPKPLTHGVGVAVSIGGQSSDIKKRKLVNPVVQKTYSIIAVIVACVLVYFVCSYISDNGNSIQSIRAELDSVRESQQRIINQLGNISEGLGKSVVRTEVIERTVESVADRNTDSAERINRSKQIISDSKSILESIRATRKETQNN